MDNIEEPFSKATALSFIAQTQIRLRDKQNADRTLKQALTIMDEIERPFTKTLSLSLIAQAQVEAGYEEDGNHTFKQAQIAAENIQQDHHLKLYALNLIAKAQSAINNEHHDTTQKISASTDLLDDIKTTVFKLYDLNITAIIKTKPWLFGNPIRDAKRYIIIARKQARVGNNDGATKTFKQALIAAEKIDNTVYKSLMLQAIARAQTETGSQDEGLATANKISLAIFKNRALRNIASLKGKNTEYGNNVIKPLSLTEVTQTLHKKFEAIVSISIERTDNKQIFYIYQAEEKARAIYNHTKTMMWIADAQAKMSHIRAASYTIKHALAIANEATDPLIKVQAFSIIAVELAKRELNPPIQKIF